VQVANLELDDLEAGSLRGSLASLVLEANLEARQGESVRQAGRQAGVA
jgi:hypothetical protein